MELIDARVPLRKAGREFQACCPFHSEKTPSFTVSPQKQFYHCFGCGAHGTALGFVMEFDRLEFPEAVRKLAEQVGLEVPEEEGARKTESHAPLLELVKKAADFYKLELKSSQRAINYLKQRGLSGETAANFGIGYAPDAWDGLCKHLGDDPSVRERAIRAGLLVRKDSNKLYDRFRGRIMFPIRDTRGRVIAFGGRVLDKGEPKYLNSPESPLFHKGRELYGLWEARQVERQPERLLVVEGYMDVAVLAQHDISNVVATLGTATTSDHLQRLFRVCEEIVFCFDGDAAGRKAAWRALETSLPAIRDGRQIRFLFLPDGEDPDSLVQAEGTKTFLQRIASAMPLSQYLLDSLQARTDIRSIDGRARLVDLAKPHLKAIPDPIFRRLLTDELAKIAAMDAETLTKLIEGEARALPTAQVRRASLKTSASASPQRKALAILLEQPALVRHAGDSETWADLDRPGLGLLARVVVFLREHPETTAAMLLERWRDTEDGNMLEKVAAAELAIPEDAFEAELVGVFELLEHWVVEKRLEALIVKLEAEGLDDAEKTEYLALLKRRRGLSEPLN